MLRSNESLRGMPMAKVAKQRISSRNAIAKVFNRGKKGED